MFGNMPFGSTLFGAILPQGGYGYGQADAALLDYGIASVASISDNLHGIANAETTTYGRVV